MSFLQYLWQHPLCLLGVYLLIMNLWLFFAMGADKFRAKRQKRRIPEARLFLLAILGGSLGGIAGMYLFRHKTRHKSFAIGFPAILAAEILIAAFLARI